MDFIEYPTLRNAPATEAVIDIHVKLSRKAEPAQFTDIYKSISKEYPKREEGRRKKLFDIREGQPVIAPEEESEFYGNRYISMDEKFIFQARIDGFTLSRLKPYINWEGLRDEAHRLWKIYAEIMIPETITRVAVRYINNLSIPTPIEDFGDFLTAPPVIPDALPQEIMSFLTRVVFYEPAYDAHAIIIQALEAAIEIPKKLPVILAIYVFKLKSGGFDSESEAWEYIERFRNLKNKIFFSSITKKLRKEYE